MSPITTHVLDTSRGRPAVGIAVILERQGADESWTEMGRDITNEEGRCKGLLPDHATLAEGIYRLRFATAAYFQHLGVHAFYPEVQVTFEIEDVRVHYHLPLLVNPFGYTTYRGS